MVAVCVYGRREGLPAWPTGGLSNLVGSDACMRSQLPCRPVNTAEAQVFQCKPARLKERAAVRADASEAPQGFWGSVEGEAAFCVAVDESG